MGPKLMLLLVVTGFAAMPAAATPAASPVVKAAFNVKLKAKILVDGKGRTLYEFDEDAGMSRPQCVGDSPPGCGKTWPGLLGTATAGAGIVAALLGTVTRSDGKLQVTYAKHPLYYFAGEPGEKPDRKPGDVNGQHLFDIWWVVSPSGKKITKLPKR